MGIFVDKLVKLNRPDKAMGFVPTCYCARNGAYVTLDEYIAHTWAAMIRGANGVSPYAYHDLNDRPSLYEGTRYIFSTFEALEDMVLFAQRTTLVKNPEYECVRYDYNGKAMFVLVNLTDKPQSVTVEGIDGTWQEFRHDRTISTNTFSLAPFETVIGTSEVMDVGLPTYQQTQELIDKLEKARCSRGSLLFERHKEISVRNSPTQEWMAGVKLFDGVLDDYAGALINAENGKFVELNISKVNPTFNKVVIHGLHTEGVKFLAGKEGELTEIVATEENSEYCTTLNLQEALNAPILRFEFPSDKLVELYEIELF